MRQRERATAEVAHSARCARLAVVEEAAQDAARETEGRRKGQLQQERAERAERTSDHSAPGPSHRERKAPVAPSTCSSIHL